MKPDKGVLICNSLFAVAGFMFFLGFNDLFRPGFFRSGVGLMVMAGVVAPIALLGLLRATKKNRR